MNKRVKTKNAIFEALKNEFIDSFFISMHAVVEPGGQL